MTSKVWDKQIAGSHYRKYKIQPSQFISENELLYPEGCAIKYIIRHRDKGKKQDLEKAKHYIDMIIERDYGDDAEKSKTYSFADGSLSFANDDPDIKISYDGLSISGEEGLPQDKTEDEILNEK